MTEPDVALTDFALSLESAVFAAILWRSRRHAEGPLVWFLLYFAAAAAAALCGGLVHGFFLDRESFGNALFWSATLLSIGLNALATWAIGAWLLFPAKAVRGVSIAAGIAFVVYAAVVLGGDNSFHVAVWMAVPATLFLLAALLYAFCRERRRGVLFAAAGIALTVAAMLLQQLGIGIDPRYFNHNSTAHVVQAVALALVFVGSLRLLSITSTIRRGMQHALSP